MKNLNEAIKELTLNMSVQFFQENEEALENLFAVMNMAQHNLRVQRHLAEPKP